jgi:hypothetical protein
MLTSAGSWFRHYMQLFVQSAAEAIAHYLIHVLWNDRLIVLW